MFFPYQQVITQDTSDTSVAVYKGVDMLKA